MGESRLAPPTKIQITAVAVRAEIVMARFFAAMVRVAIAVSVVATAAIPISAAEDNASINWPIQLWLRVLNRGAESFSR